LAVDGMIGAITRGLRSCEEFWCGMRAARQTSRIIRRRFRNSFDISNNLRGVWAIFVYYVAVAQT
jgi:hypothetical protein